MTGECLHSTSTFQNPGTTHPKSLGVYATASSAPRKPKPTRRSCGKIRNKGASKGFFLFLVDRPFGGGPSTHNLCRAAIFAARLIFSSVSRLGPTLKESS